MEKLRTVIVGSGTIGLAFGVALASQGNLVVLCDTDHQRLSMLENDQLDIDEKTLRCSLRDAVSCGKISFSKSFTSDGSATNFIVCIPTTGSNIVELSELVASIAATASSDDAIFIRSTVPPGTTRSIHEMLRSRLGRQIMLGVMPDRSVEGRTYTDQFNVPHLLGAIDEGAEQRGAALLQTIGKVVLVSNPETAEASKMFCNVWRAGTFALANALTMIAEDQGVDMKEVISLASQGYPRFDPPLPGIVGGPCLIKDTQMLADVTRQESRYLLDGILKSEAALKNHVSSVAKSHLSQFSGSPVRVAFLGLAFKGVPAVTDLRGSAAVDLARDIKASFPRAVLVGWDPSSTELSVEGLELGDCPYNSVRGSDLVVIGHDHPAILKLNWSDVYSSIGASGLVLDLTGRAGLPSEVSMSRSYWGLGRNSKARRIG